MLVQRLSEAQLGGVQAQIDKGRELAADKKTKPADARQMETAANWLEHFLKREMAARA